MRAGSLPRRRGRHFRLFVAMPRHADGPVAHGSDGQKRPQGSQDLCRRAAGVRRDKRDTQWHRHRQFPAANSQGVDIRKNAKNKNAAWELIKWALSPEISMRLVKERGHSSVCRRSVIESEAYRKLNTVNGQDIGAIYLEVLELPAKGENYMAYRTVKEFPIVGDVINKAVDQVVTGQLSGHDAMNAAQEQAIANLRRSGTAL